MITLAIDFGKTTGTVGKIHAPGCTQLLDGGNFDCEPTREAAIEKATEDGCGFMDRYVLCPCAEKVIDAAAAQQPPSARIAALTEAIAAIEAVPLPTAGVTGKRAEAYRTAFLHAVRALLVHECGDGCDPGNCAVAHAAEFGV